MPCMPVVGSPCPCPLGIVQVRKCSSYRHDQLWLWCLCGRHKRFQGFEGVLQRVGGQDQPTKRRGTRKVILYPTPSRELAAFVAHR
eukprot:scaffold235284_cov33-Tisochrysis_lutea.AAC.1